MKKILFVVNTLNEKDGANTLLTLLRAIDSPDYSVDLYIMMNCGDVFSQLPEGIHLLNKRPFTSSSKKGADRMYHTFAAIKNSFRNGAFLTSIPYMFANLWRMLEANKIYAGRLHDRMIANGGKRFKTEYDIAIAFSEGAATYYVADYVKALKKAAWVYRNCNLNEFNEYLDEDAYDKMDKVFATSESIKEAFLEVHPECMGKTEIYHEIIDQDTIRRLAKEGTPDGFEDKGLRLLTVGRLSSQKAYDVAIQAMVYLRKWHYPIKWYVIGDGPLRKPLQDLINQKKLTDYFILLGEKANPYPYFANCDIYVHATRFEGKSIAIQEAQTLGCAVIVSDVNGNREQIENGYDGVVCNLNGKKLAEAIADMAEDPYIRKRMGNRNMNKNLDYSGKNVDQLFRLIEAN